MKKIINGRTVITRASRLGSQPYYTIREGSTIVKQEDVRIPEPYNRREADASAQRQIAEGLQDYHGRY